VGEKHLNCSINQIYNKKLPIPLSHYSDYRQLILSLKNLICENKQNHSFFNHLSLGICFYSQERVYFQDRKIDSIVKYKFFIILKEVQMFTTRLLNEPISYNYQQDPWLLHKPRMTDSKFHTNLSKLINIKF